MKYNLITMPNNQLKKQILFFLFLCVVQLSFGADSYYNGLSKSQATKNYNEINTNGTIRNIEEVPNLKVSQNKNVIDPHFMLPDFAEDMIQDITDQLKSEKDYEIIVLCLNSIGDENPRTWGTDLFNLWGIGDRETENGLLILVLNDVHKVEFITGRGMEGVLTDAESFDIQQKQMIPYFKKNDYATGVIRGVQAVNDVLNGKAVLYDSNPDDLYEAPPYVSPPFYKSGLFIGYAIFCGALMFFYFIFLFLAFSTKDLHKRYRTMKFWTLLIFAFIAPIPFVFLVIYTRKTQNKWRNTDRIGLKSGDLLHKLNEEEEDQHLTKGQITEEVVKSIDYDVWVNVAGDDIVILPYRNWFTPYNKCEKCKYKTYIKLYDKTVYAATYTSSGKGEKKYECKNCGHTKIITYTIPRKQKSSGGGYYSGGGSFSGGGGGFSSGGGGFSGGSFGGGGSRGGGAGSSW